MRHMTVAIAAVLLALGGTAGCAAQPPEPQASANPASILASSSPAAGSTVRAPESLALRFHPPARLDEVKVTGPGGTMPMMVHSVGEVADYDLPVPGLAPGAYSVEWQATAGGNKYNGRFSFTVAP